MAHYNISSEGSYTLADLEAKLRSITDWEWSEHDEETAEFKAGQDLYEEALQMYESIRISYLKTFDDARLASKSELRRFARVWDANTPDKYHVPPASLE